MTSKQFIKYLQDPGQFSDASVVEFETLIKQFPYFQTAHLLYLENLNAVDPKSAQEKLHDEAIYICDRSILYNILNNSVKNNDSADKKVKSSKIVSNTKGSSLEDIMNTHEKLVNDFFQSTEKVQNENCDMIVTNVNSDGSIKKSDETAAIMQEIRKKESEEGSVTGLNQTKQAKTEISNVETTKTTEKQTVVTTTTSQTVSEKKPTSTESSSTKSAEEDDIFKKIALLRKERQAAAERKEEAEKKADEADAKAKRETSEAEEAVRKAKADQEKAEAEALKAKQDAEDAAKKAEAEALKAKQDAEDAAKKAEAEALKAKQDAEDAAKKAEADKETIVSTTTTTTTTVAETETESCSTKKMSAADLLMEKLNKYKAKSEQNKNQEKSEPVNVEKKVVDTTTQNDQKTDVEEDLISKFIEEAPRIDRNKPVSEGDMSNSSNSQPDGLYSERLAELYKIQKLYDKSLAIYNKLILKYPEKSDYFAGKIDELNTLINNNK